MNDPAANFNPRTDTRECAAGCDCHALACANCGLEMFLAPTVREFWLCHNPACSEEPEDVS